jgi:predicted transposase/invertase (TIGR01784 family)
MTDLRNPHDSFFKEIFSRPEHARDFLQHYLPAEVAALLDLSTLDISKDSFVDPDLQQHFSDLLYQVKLHDQSAAYVYVLFEHKSYPEPLLAFQLLRYLVRIWEQALKQDQGLVPILPLVLYHGRSRWAVSTSFQKLLSAPSALHPYLPDFRYLLCDLSQYSEAEIKGEIILQVVLRLLKYSLRPEINERLGETFALLRQLSEQETALQYLQTFLRYLSQGSEPLREETLKQAVKQLFEEGDSPMPTLAEQWLKQGEAIGLEKGEAIGLEKGRATALNILRRYLATRFGVALEHFDTELQPLDLAALTALSDAAFEASSLAEFQSALAELATTPPRPSTPSATNGEPTAPSTPTPE